MASIVLTPYLLAYNSPIKARVYASNSNGEGAASIESTTNQVVITVPLQPSTSPQRGASSDYNQIEVTWAALVTPQDGGSAITSYQLLWDSGVNGGMFSEVVGFSSPYTSTSKIISVTPATTYQFKYAAQNVIGWGTFSSVSSIKAASRPSKIATVTTAIENQYVKISWSYPTDNYDTVTAYDIQIQAANSSFLNQATYCDGNQTAIVTNRYCHVPMTILRETGTFNLAYNSLVVVRIRARNTIERGDFSDVNAVGAMI